MPAAQAPMAERPRMTGEAHVGVGLHQFMARSAPDRNSIRRSQRK
jgi:hypothetical protein